MYGPGRHTHRSGRLFVQRGAVLGPLDQRVVQHAHRILPARKDFKQLSRLNAIFQRLHVVCTLRRGYCF